MLTFAAAMPMATLAAMTREHDTGVWRIVAHHVHAARDQLDCCGVRRVGVDETSARTGQDYVSIFADLDARRVLFATEDRGADTVARGYRNKNKMITIIYLTAAKLPLPTVTNPTPASMSSR